MVYFHDLSYNTFSVRIESTPTCIQQKRMAINTTVSIWKYVVISHYVFIQEIPFKKRKIEEDREQLFNKMVLEFLNAKHDGIATTFFQIEDLMTFIKSQYVSFLQVVQLNFTLLIQCLYLG